MEKKFLFPLFLSLVTVTSFSLAHADSLSTREVLSQHCHYHADTLELFDALDEQWQSFAAEREGHWSADRLYQAVEFAAEKHKGQVRKDTEQSPYIIHPLRVCAHLWQVGAIRSANTLTAAILHDTLEDTTVTFEELRSLFGDRVAYVVQEVTNDPALSSEKNKQRQVDHAPQMSLDGQLVKLADRIDNLWCLTQAIPVGWDEKKVDDYWNWGKQLRDALHGTNTPMERHLDTMFEAYDAQALQVPGLDEGRPATQ